jgi:ActR/RegA family two-component response regulator
MKQLIPKGGMMQNKTQQKLLFVDGEKELTEIFSVYFSKRGFLVETACSGSDGLKKAREFSPCTIVSDLHMANGSGVFLFESLFNEGILPQQFIVCAGNVEEWRDCCHWGCCLGICA